MISMIALPGTVDGLTLSKEEGHEPWIDWYMQIEVSR
jgi:hypothetical protein